MPLHVTRYIQTPIMQRKVQVGETQACALVDSGYYLGEYMDAIWTLADYVELELV